MVANPDCTYHVVGTQRDDHTQYARTDGTRAFTGTITAPAHAATGLTGATAASRYVGATASGAPGSGTFATGDFIIDQTGLVWVCTTGGTPGTWVPLGGANQSAGTSGPAIAGALSTTLPLYTQSGYKTGTPNGSGALSVTFPTAFANGVSSIVITPVNVSTQPNPAFVLDHNSVPPTVSAFQVFCYTGYALLGNLNTTTATAFSWVARGN